VTDLVVAADGHRKCRWPVGDPLYEAYHDEEWGRPVVDDIGLYEKIALEGFQAGLSWITILRKRDAFRSWFAGFDPAVVARFGEREVVRMLGDPGIIRHRGKLRSAINNAGRAIEAAEEFGSLRDYLWRFAPAKWKAPRSFVDIAATSPASDALGRDLKRRGWSFVGSTTMHAFMQSVGMVDDHLVGCFVRGVCERDRLPVLRARR
jgi:DNA-3-methyladenine glycosylase I